MAKRMSPERLDVLRPHLALEVIWHIEALEDELARADKAGQEADAEIARLTAEIQHLDPH